MTIHRKKLAEIKAITNNHQTREGAIIINKGKNEQILEDRYTEIERENRLLFEKITHIHLKGGNVPLAPQTLNGHGSHKRMSTSIMNTSGTARAGGADQQMANTALDLKLVKERLRHMD